MLTSVNILFSFQKLPKMFWTEMMKFFQFQVYVN